VKQIAAFSGGDDSTAMVLRMAALGEDFECLFTPAGNEPPELFEHVNAVIERIQRPLVHPPNLSLMFWIQKYQALPNHAQRWCTRQIKIEPCKAYLLQHPGSVLCVGLRADEDAREGLYGELATYRYPLREWGWKEADVQRYNAEQGVTVPTRTNCLLCYDQRLGEWWELWKSRPEEWEKGEIVEAQTGHTFRSPGRDTWPAPLKELRERFEAGHIPRGANYQRSIFDEDAHGRCRICRF